MRYPLAAALIALTSLGMANGGVVPAYCHSQPMAMNDWAGMGLGNDLRAPSWDESISTDDLIRMRNLGGAAVSPDGTLISFSVSQADPGLDTYRIRWFVAAVDGSALPRALQFDGGQPIPNYIYGLPQAYIPAPKAQWSPDGNWLAVRRMEGARIELWIVNVRDGVSKRVPDGGAEVIEFEWANATTLTFKTGINYDRFEQNLKYEAKHGWLFDGRIPTYSSTMRPGKPDCTVSALDAACDNANYNYIVGGSLLRTAGSNDIGKSQIGGATGAKVVAQSEQGKGDTAAMPLRRIAVEGRINRTCEATACVGSRFKDFGFIPGTGDVWFIKSEGSTGSLDGAPGDLNIIYRWNMKSNRVSVLLRVDGVLDGCSVLAKTAVCEEESARQPRRIVGISMLSGNVRLIADPNPMFSRKKYPRTEKIIIRDSEGNIGFSHIVFPSNYKKGNKYPAIITQYHSKGFLRGNVGDEYPIYPLAESGFMVIDVDWPSRAKLALTTDWDGLNRAYTVNGRQLVWEAIRSAITTLNARGLIDTSRLALTGLSGGAENVNFVLQRTNLFRAGIASSGAVDLSFFAIIPDGEMRRALMNDFKTASIIPPAGNELYEYAWSSHAKNLRTPLLINVGQYEALVGIEGTQSILDNGGPLEMRIFPGENHIKYRPSTFAGIYRNNMQWLKYWLLDKKDQEPEFALQYARWDKMREKVEKPEGK